MVKYVQTQFDWSAGREADATPTVPPVEPAKALTQATLPGIAAQDDSEGDAPVAPRQRRRSPATLPVPKPLPSAIGRGHFGEDEHGPIRPTAAEVRAISENHAERLINLLEGLAEVEKLLRNPQCSDRARLYHEKDRLQSAYQSAIAVYAEDFGEYAAQRLDVYARHQFEQPVATGCLDTPKSISVRVVVRRVHGSWKSLPS